MALLLARASCVTDPATLLEIVQTVAQEESQDKTNERSEQAEQK